MCVFRNFEGILTRGNIITLVYLSFFVLFIYGCDSVQGSEDRPSSQEEFEAEARILALDQSMTLNNARIALARTYDEFRDFEIDYFSPRARYLEFINCTSTAGPKVFDRRGTTIVTYSSEGIRQNLKKITLKDSCSDRTMTKFYCVDDRPAYTSKRCSSRCWMEYHCR